MIEGSRQVIAEQAIALQLHLLKMGS
jgi:hypothetical protein